MGFQTVNTTERLAKLRELMSQPEYNVDAYVIPSEDQHASEYIAGCDERRAFISGFNGSAGCAVVMKDEALLFTDGRYFLQAESQLDKNWTLMKTGMQDVPTWQEYLQKEIKPSSRVGIDASLVSIDDASSLSQAMEPRKCQLVSLSQNLTDLAWGKERPSMPAAPIFYLEEKFSGESHISKLKRLREEMSKQKSPVFVLTALDEIAWLFNLRGSDIDYNPVFFSYAIVTQDAAILFTDNKLQNGGDLQNILGGGVEVQPYASFWQKLQDMARGSKAESEEKILIGKNASLAVANAIGEGKYKSGLSPVTIFKAVKNNVELEGFRQCHIRDGVALVKYFAWLEEELNLGHDEHTEYEAADKLEQYRIQQPHFKGSSFETISSTGPNGAIIHYAPDSKNSDVIKKDQVYLCDSGGQYSDGTTDVTRTWHFGTPTDEEKRAFTRVLQGHIAFDTAIFPNGTTGYIIDSWARQFLWKDGLDYLHGTGHGVGHFLNVHEGPHGVGFRIGHNANPLKAGNTVTNEPGYYADGKFGIRIENVLLVKEVKTPNNFGDKGYLGFENVTMCPIHTNLIEKSLLSAGEIKWLNQYHQEVFEKLSPLLQNDRRALDWLTKECAAI